MYINYLFVCCLFIFSFTSSVTIFLKSVATSGKSSCPFTEMQVYKTLPIEAEKYGHPIEISWSPNNRYFASGTVVDEQDANTKFNLFIVWDTQTWSKLLDFELPSNYYAQSISWSPDNNHVAIFYRNRLFVWNIATWNYVEISVPEASIYRVSWIDNNSLMTLSDTGSWLGTDIKPYGNVSRLWNTVDGVLIHDFGVIGIQSQVASVDTRWLIVTNNGNELHAYYEDDPSHNLLRLQNTQLIDVNTKTLELVTITKAQNITTIQVWELMSGKSLINVSSSQYTGTGHFLDGSQFLLLNKYDSSGEIWKIEEQQMFPHLDINLKDYKSVRTAWSLATLCAAASIFPDNDPTTSSLIYLFDITDGRHIADLKGHKEGFYINRLVWSINGQLLASSSNDDTIIIWQGY